MNNIQYLMMYRITRSLLLQATVHSALLLVVTHCLADDFTVCKEEDLSCETPSVENATISYYMRLLVQYQAAVSIAIYRIR